MKHQVIVKGCYYSDVFEWMFSTIRKCCGDGGAVMVCSNPEEVCKAYKEWMFLDSNGPKLHMSELMQEYCSATALVTSSEENHIFTDKLVDATFGEDVFVIKEDCKDWNGNAIIKAYEGEV